MKALQFAYGIKRLPASAALAGWPLPGALQPDRADGHGEPALVDGHPLPRELLQRLGDGPAARAGHGQSGHSPM